MNLRFTFYFPQTYEKTEEVRTIGMLLNEITSIMGIESEKRIMEGDIEEKIKKRLQSISVEEKIQIKKTKKARNLYPQLVIFFKDEPLIFYPQIRKGEIQEIPIIDFLEGLLKGEIRTLTRLERKAILEKELFKNRAE